MPKTNTDLLLLDSIDALETALLQVAPELTKEMNAQAGNPAGLERKLDGSVVTALDREIEEKLRSLTTEYLSLPHFFLGEEGEELHPSSPADVLANELLVICDPIDGTQNFVAGSDWFGSLYAVYRKEGALFTPLLGAIIVPQAEKIYIRTHRSLYGLHLSSGEREPIEYSMRSESALDDRVRVSAFRSSRKLFRSENVSFTKRFASIADGLDVLRGNIDIATMRGKWWDVAAIFALIAPTDFELFSTRTATEFVGFSAEDFVLDNERALWKVKHPFLLMRPKLGAALESILVPEFQKLLKDP